LMWIFISVNSNVLVNIYTIICVRTYKRRTLAPVTLGPCGFGHLDRWIFGPLDYRTIEMLISGPLGPQAVRLLRSSGGPRHQKSGLSANISMVQWSKRPKVQGSKCPTPHGPSVQISKCLGVGSPRDQRSPRIYFYMYICTYICICITQTVLTLESSWRFAFGSNERVARARDTERDRERHREALRDTERHRETQEDTERHRGTQKDTEKRRKTQIDTERNRETQRDTERHLLLLMFRCFGGQLVFRLVESCFGGGSENSYSHDQKTSHY
jgi:hypothetical protein